MAKKIVALYIDDTSLRVLETRGKRVKKWGDLPLEFGPAKINAAIKEAEVVTKIKQLFKGRKIRTKRVIVGLSGLHCLTRPLILPQLPRAMLNEAVMREAKRVLPVPVEELYISWQVILSPPEQTQVFLVAIPRKTADALLKVLQEVGLKPSLMDLKPLVLAKVVKEPTAIIVDIQSTEFDIVIKTKGVPQPIRTVPFPAEMISLQDRMPVVRDEVSRTIEFYNSNNPENPLKTDVTLFVSGELAGEPKLCEELSKEVGHPVLPISAPLKYPEQLDTARYMVNMGLVLKEVEKETVPSVANLNALPTPYRPKPVPWLRIAILPSAAVVIGLLAFLIVWIQEASADVEQVRTELDATTQILKQRQDQKKELTASIADLEKKIAQVEASRNTFTTALNGLAVQGSVINGDLKTSTGSLINTVSLVGISHTGSTLTLRGVAANEEEVLSYARRLDASERFSEITITSLRKLGGEGADYMDFTLALKTGGKD